MNYNYNYNYNNNNNNNLFKKLFNYIHTLPTLHTLFGGFRKLNKYEIMILSNTRKRVLL